MQARQGLARTQKEFPFDGLFFHTQVPAMLCPDWLQRIPSIISLDATPIQYDELGESYEHFPGPEWLENLKFKLHRHCFNAARHLVVWSQWTKDGLVKDYGIPDGKITVVPPGVNLKEWSWLEGCEKNPGVVKILFVGGNFERKGGSDLLEAFHTLQNNRSASQPKLELHLVTQDQIAEQENIFVYHGIKPNSPDLKRLFFTTDIFCLPTRGDCLPMVLAEAGAAGLPVVSTQLAGIPELVKDGENGFLIQPKDIKGLTDSLSRLTANASMRKAMGNQSRKIVETGHNVESNTNRLVKIFRNVIDEARR